MRIHKSLAAGRPHGFLLKCCHREGLSVGCRGGCKNRDSAQPAGGGRRAQTKGSGSDSGGMIVGTAGRHTATSGERTAVQAAYRESSFHARRRSLFC